MKQSKLTQTAYMQSLLTTLTKNTVAPEQIVQWIELETRELANQQMKANLTQAAIEPARHKEN